MVWGVPVVISTFFLLLVLSLLVMAAVALPQLLAGKTVFSQAGLDQVDIARRRAAASGAESVEFGPDLPVGRGRMRAPIGWAETAPGPRHAR